MGTTHVCTSGYKRGVCDYNLCKYIRVYKRYMWLQLQGIQEVYVVITNANTSGVTCGYDL